MRRVSSRPRLVSDADRAFQNASLDLDHIDHHHHHHHNIYHNNGDGDIDDGHELLHKSQGGRQQQQQQQQQQGYYSYFVFNDDRHGHDDDVAAGNNNSSSSRLINVNDEEHKKKSPLAVTSTTVTAAVLINNNDEDSSDDDDNNSLSNYLSCNDLSTLEISFSKKTSLSSDGGEGEGGLETAVVTSAAASAVAATTSSNLSGAAAATYSVKRKRLSQSPLNHHHHQQQQQQQQQQQHYLTPNSSYAELLPTVDDIVQTFPTTIKNSHNTAYTTYTNTHQQQQHHMSRYQYYNKEEEVVKGYHNQHHHQSATTLLNQLPSETILNITTYLPHSNIRTLSMTNKHIRHVIMCSVASHSEIWMRYLMNEFPYVFGNTDSSISSNKNVKLVDDFHLPMAGVVSSSQGSLEHTMNLPLLTGLLVQRYPQEVDLNGTGGRGGGSVRGRRWSDDDNHGDEGGELFRSFYMNIPTHHTHTTTAPEGRHVQVQDDEANNVATSSVPVIQFTGRAGTGDRSIRSDKPFPPNCRVIAHSSSHYNNDSSASSSVGGLRSISTWMKNHTPLRSRGNKRKSGRRSSSSATSALLRREDSSSPPRRHHHHALFPNHHASTNNTSMTVFPAISLSFSPSARRNVLIPPPPSATAATPMTIIPPSPPSQRSPLFRFLSSLSHHCTSVSSSNNSSFVDNDETFADMDNGDIIGRSIDRTFSMDPNDGSEDGDDDDDEDGIGVNDYGMMLRSNGHGLLEQCKLKFGKMCDGHCNKSTNNLRPFVIPTVVASSVGERTVDVTPRLVAYFEVTILDQQGEEEGGASSNNRGVHDARRQPQPAAANLPNIHGHNERPRRDNPLPRRRDLPRQGRIPHRVFPPIHLPLPFDPVFFAPLEQEGRVAQAAADALREQLQPRDHHRDRLFVPNLNQQQRHDCVAIGLSTLSFNPRSKMPGWDDYSFGYHGDDGGIFHGHGDMLRRYGPSFGPGDIVGCGLEYSTRKIFFVKNGEFLGWAFEKIDKEMVERGLYPTVGVDTECPIHVNFGQVPFKFDWKKFGKEKLYV